VSNEKAKILISTEEAIDILNRQQCPLCGTLLIDDNNNGRKLCHRCGWAIWIKMDKPDEKKLKLILAQNAKLNLISDDSFRREIKVPNIDLKKDR
jgi:ribosomal protein S27AE